MINLQSLSLNGNMIKEIICFESKNIAFPYLEDINLSNNQLTSLNINNCSRLKKLSISNN